MSHPRLDFVAISQGKTRHTIRAHYSSHTYRKDTNEIFFEKYKCVPVLLIRVKMFPMQNETRLHWYDDCGDECASKLFNTALLLQIGTILVRPNGF